MKKIYRQKNDSDGVEIDIIPIFKEILRRWWIILLAGILVGGATFAVTKLTIEPTFRCGFSAYVNNKHLKQNTDSLTSSDMSAARELGKTYSHILKSESVLSAAAKAIKLDIGYNELSKMVSTEIMDETEIIAIYVVDRNPQAAFNLAQSIAKVAPGYMANIVEGSSMKIIDNPQYNENRYKPNYIQFSLIGFIVGMLIVIAHTVIRFLADDTVKSEVDMESRFSLPILGVIPDISRANGKDSSYYDYNYYYSGHKNEVKKSEANNEET